MLILSTWMSLGLLMLRARVVGHRSYRFLIWDWVLAWVPLCLFMAIYLLHQQGTRNPGLLSTAANYTPVATPGAADTITFNTTPTSPSRTTLGGTVNNTSATLTLNGGVVILNKTSGTSVHALGAGTSLIVVLGRTGYCIRFRLSSQTTHGGE